jgi:predicted ATP-dependent Lon-type protease
MENWLSAGTTSSDVKEDIRNTYNYIRANEKAILSQNMTLMRMDITVQVTALLGSTQQAGYRFGSLCRYRLICIRTESEVCLRGNRKYFHRCGAIRTCHQFLRPRIPPV